MKRKIRIQTVSAWIIGITIVMAVVFVMLSVRSESEFQALQRMTDEYIICEKSAKQLQEASDYLTEQARLYAMTGETQYRDNYFEEVKVARRREHALDSLEVYFDGTVALKSLRSALDASDQLMEREYYSMRLVAEAAKSDFSTLPKELQNVEMETEDSVLSYLSKMQKARNVVSDDDYERTKTEIMSAVTECLSELLTTTRNRQGRASMIFSDMYLKLEIGIGIFVILLLWICVMLRRLIVKPLISYNESIRKGEIFPVVGAVELQNLATTYNTVYLENQEIQKLIRHQAEHDALTQLLNRRSFEHMLHVYEDGKKPFALILIDVDTFKSVNDTFGHAMGDRILQKVSGTLLKQFQSIDHVCSRIGGDEFAIVMVDMTSDMKYVIQEKIDDANEELSNPKDDLPAVSLSVGVAFSDRENPGESIFKDADKALYHVKKHGRHGCSFY